MGYPAIDQPAPTIEVSEWISGTPEKENGFSGKNVILEFWSTHCGPCIAAIPHLNELVATYGSKDTLFVSLTREEPHTIERFLEKRPIKGGSCHRSRGCNVQCLWHTKYPSYLSHRLTRSTSLARSSNFFYRRIVRGVSPDKQRTRSSRTNHLFKNRAGGHSRHPVFPKDRSKCFRSQRGQFE